MAEDKDKTPKGDINFEYNQSTTGLNMDNIPSQIDKGSLSYALNATVENFDSNSVTYQNEPGTEFCLKYPPNYVLIGRYLIPEQAKHIYFLANPITGESEIGFMVNNDCIYHKLINANCLNFDVNYPIHKVVHKVGNCGTEIYWAQPNSDRRYLNLDKIPYLSNPFSTPCDPSLTDQLDCNQIRVQPNYDIPKLIVTGVLAGGNLIAGTYQFAFQYSDALGNPLTSYHSVTNPTPIADPQLTTVNFNYPVGKSIVLDISNIETSGQYGFFNIAVLKTINGITSVEMIGVYPIEGTQKEIVYSGQNMTQIRLTVNDVFERFPFYGPADDVTTAQDVLIWKGLAASERVNYQWIANQVQLLWETYRIPPEENYSDELNATHLRGYLRDEVYPFEIVFLLRSGKQTDAFHIPGRKQSQNEINQPFILPSNDDFIEDPDAYPNGVEYWRIYNTATVIGNSTGYTTADSYKGPYQYGEFAYWESGDFYPCDVEMWGELSEQPIRHHKFPDVEISPIFESKDFSDPSKIQMGNAAIFPIGVKINPDQVQELIATSALTREQKADVVGFKIVRGDRTDNKSIVAKGMLRNVNKYTRDEKDYYFPNYPYNDLGEDPFILEQNNAYTKTCHSYVVYVDAFNQYPYLTDDDTPHVSIRYIECVTNEIKYQKYTTLGPQIPFCSLEFPTLQPGIGKNKVNDYTMTDEGPKFRGSYETIGGSIVNYNLNTVTIIPEIYDVYEVKESFNCYDANYTWLDFTGDINDFHFKWIRESLQDPIPPATDPPPETLSTFQIWAIHGSPPPTCTRGCGTRNFCSSMVTFVGTVGQDNCKREYPLFEIKNDPNLAYRQIFNSPETSFGQPFLGDVLKLESVIFGTGTSHFVEVKDNAKYRLLSLQAQMDAETKASSISGNDAAAFFSAYEALIQIYIAGLERQNFAYSYNSIADYNCTVSVPDDLEVKQRRIDLKKYLIPVIQNVGEKDITVNNYQRETSVYLRTEGSDDLDPAPLPFPHKSPNMVVGTNSIMIEDSRHTVSEIKYCDTPEKEYPINVVSYYASLKNTFRSQWGQIYSYNTIDTGYQVDLYSQVQQPTTIFGGDTFICRFAYKTKLPFFIDNRVGAPDDSEIFYDEIGNIGFPKYWHSARSITADADTQIGILENFFSYKAHEFDCPNNQEVPTSDPNRLFYDGIFYLFAYGIPNFYVETSYNVDLRQAFNNKEGDFWPHVANNIPDDWVQESWVSIANDNTYNYNVTYSKQNKETFFSHIPVNFGFKECEFIYPFRAIFSDPQIATADTTINNWLTYRASAYFDFPQNYGKLTALDGIDNRQVLARFENKSLLYNAMYTAKTNTGGNVFLGQSLFSRDSPPFDYGETDLGFVGSQHKFLLKIPQGQISIDAKRGQVFLLNSSTLKDLSAPGTGMNRFFTDHLAFEILRYFPDADIDNNFNTFGLHGVYDSKFDRIIITKLDYVPLSKDIIYDDVTKTFYKQRGTGDTIIKDVVLLSDKNNFCNKSWTISYSFVTDHWLSFHSYLPNWYMGENNFFYSGKKLCCSTFDFIFLAGELVPNPPITTTTSTTGITTSTTSTTSTTTTLACNLDGGAVEVLACNLAGTAVVLIPPVTPPCTRPAGLSSFTLYTGYSIVAPPSVVVSTGSEAAACNAKNYVFFNSITNVIPSSIIVETSALILNRPVFLGNGTNDCTFPPDGYYYTLGAEDFLYQIANGIISNIFLCDVVTTTSTTTQICNSFIYQVEFATCNTCTPIEGGSISNSQALSQRMWYYDPISGLKFSVGELLSCSSVAPVSHILNSSGRSLCAEVPCPTTTTTTTT